MLITGIWILTSNLINCLLTKNVCIVDDFTWHYINLHMTLHNCLFLTNTRLIFIWNWCFSSHFHTLYGGENVFLTISTIALKVSFRLWWKNFPSTTYFRIDVALQDFQCCLLGWGFTKRTFYVCSKRQMNAGFCV